MESLIFGVFLDVKVVEYVVCMIVMRSVIDNVFDLISDLLL